MQRSSQRGFTVLEALLILIILAAITAVGWFVWNKNSHHKDAVKPKAQTSQTAQAAAKDKQTDPYEGWKSYSNAVYGVSFKYPAEWKVEEVAATNPDSATRQEYSISLKRTEEAKYNDTAGIEVLDENLDQAAKWYDETLSSLTKTVKEVGGRRTLQYLSPSNSTANSKMYLFAVGNKTYAFGSVNEELNFQLDADYWSKFGKVLNSLQINL